MAAISPHSVSNADFLTAEDDMEISSDAGRPRDDDIDIDIDLTGGREDHIEDEFMLEDDIDDTQVGLGSSNTRAIKDDVMADSDDGDNVAQDEVLRDASVSLEDTAIQDVASIPQSNAEIPATQASAPLAKSYEQSHPADATIVQHNFGGPHADEAQADPSGQETLSVGASGESQAPELANQEADALHFKAASTAVDDNHQEDNAHQAAYTADTLPTDASLPLDQQTEESRDSVAAPKEPFSEHVEHDEDHTDVARHVHPTVVVYDNTEISLFPPTNPNAAQTYFLNDESLANQTIGDILQACRKVLGESIGDEDELELSVAVLGLTLSETCSHAAQYSFANLLDTYVQLCHNDSIEDPGPLYVTLTTRTNFSTRLDSLLMSASKGKGLSELDFLHLDDDIYDQSDPLSFHEDFEGGNEAGEEEEQRHTAEKADAPAEISKIVEGATTNDETSDDLELPSANAEATTTQQSTGNQTLEKSGEVSGTDRLLHSQIGDGSDAEEEEEPEGGEDLIEAPHAEDDLLRFDDEDVQHGEEQSSSGSSTVQGEAATTNTQGTDSNVLPTDEHDGGASEGEFQDQFELIEHEDRHVEDQEASFESYQTEEITTFESGPKEDALDFLEDGEQEEEEEEDDDEEEEEEEEEETSNTVEEVVGEELDVEDAANAESLVQVPADSTDESRQSSGDAKGAQQDVSGDSEAAADQLINFDGDNASATNEKGPILGKRSWAESHARLDDDSSELESKKVRSL